MKTLFKLLVLVFLAGAGWLAYSIASPVTPPTAAPIHTLVLKSGSTARQIARLLESEGVIRNRYAFLFWHTVDGRKSLKAGEYQFIASANVMEVHARIVRGDVFARTVVIPEGFNLYEIAYALDAAGICTAGEFVKVARTEKKIIADLDSAAPSLEGYLFPDTYNFSRTQTAHDVAALMVRRFRQEAENIGLNTNDNMHRTVTLASIVEKETSVAEERPVVAGVFENRLAKHIALATDPSVIYASLLIGKYDGVIRESDLQLDSAYNTYKKAGLPPGPIANPGRAALQAAMHPDRNDYLYFVANNKGGHNFAKTLDEHNRNVASYRKGAAQK